MAGLAFVVGEEDHRLTIGRNVRCPVVQIVGGDLLGTGAIRMHAPDLHIPAAIGIEVNVLAVRRVIRVVVNFGACGEGRLGSTVRGDGVDVSAAALDGAGEENRPAIRRPAMPVGAWILGDESRRSSAGRDDVDMRLRLVRAAATDCQPLAVRGKTMTSVAPGEGGNIERLGSAALCGTLPEASILTEDEVGAILRPVGRLG